MVDKVQFRAFYYIEVCYITAGIFQFTENTRRKIHILPQIQVSSLVVRRNKFAEFHHVQCNSARHFLFSAGRENSLRVLRYTVWFNFYFLCVSFSSCFLFCMAVHDHPEPIPYDVEIKQWKMNVEQFHVDLF